LKAKGPDLRIVELKRHYNASARWIAQRVDTTLAAEKPRHDRVTCYKLTAAHAEQAYGRDAGSICN